MTSRGTSENPETSGYANELPGESPQVVERAPLPKPFLPEGGVDLNFCCEALALVAEATAWSSDPAETYKRMVDAVAEATGCDQVHLHLLSEAGDRLVRTAYHAKQLSAPQWSNRMDLDVGRLRWMIDMNLPLVTNFDNPHESDRIPEEAITQGVRSAVSLPLKADAEFMGTCTVVYVENVTWDEARLAYLMRMSRMIATTVKRIRSSQKASELLLLDERKRLGVEMHNNVSSLLASLALTAAAAMASYDEGSETNTRAELERLEALAGRAIRALRSETMALRIPFEKTENLIEAYAHLVKGLQQNWGIEVEFSVEPEEDQLDIPPEVTLQLVRILNESFSNVIHHAKASKVRVALLRTDRIIALTIEDNGAGFDASAVPASCMGFRIMRERAASVGGSLTVISDEGGTTVFVDIPCRWFSTEG